MKRRAFMQSVGAGAAAVVAAPWVVTRAGVLMPVRSVPTPKCFIYTTSSYFYKCSTPIVPVEWANITDYWRDGDVNWEPAAIRATKVGTRGIFFPESGTYYVKEPDGSIDCRLQQIVEHISVPL